MLSLFHVSVVAVGCCLCSWFVVFTISVMIAVIVFVVVCICFACAVLTGIGADALAGVPVVGCAGC